MLVDNLAVPGESALVTVYEYGIFAAGMNGSSFVLCRLL